VTDESATGRRAHERVRLPLRVAYRSTGSFLISYTVDLSRGGLFLETAEPRSVGSELELRLDIPGVGEEIRLQGVVVWIQREPAPGKPMGMGIQFQEVEASFGNVIDQLVRHFSGLRVLVASSAPRVRNKLVRSLKSSLAATYTETDLAKPPPAETVAETDLAVIDLAQGDASAQALLETVFHAAAPPAVVALASHPRVRRWAHDLGAQEVVNSPPASSELLTAVLRALARPMVRDSDLEDA